MPLIAAENTFALAAAIMVLVAAAMWAERTEWGQRLGGPLLLIAGAMLASNVGIIPHSAPLYGTVAGFLVPAAIPLLLLRADFRTIFQESGRMVTAFLLAAAATVAGAFAAALLVNLGPLEPQISGTVTASYIGGSLNFVATAEAVGIRDSSIYVAALSADAVGAVFFLLALMLLPTLKFVRAAMPSKFIGAPAIPAPDTDQPGRGSGETFNLPGAANGLAVSLVICAAAAWLTAVFDVASLYILAVTAIALLVANLGKPVVRRVSADFELGTLLMYVFFACIGAGADVAEVIDAALPILAFIIVMVGVHLILIVIGGRLFRLDLAEVMIASNACILGPAPAAALAASKGWKALVAPGILIGMLGYAVATFIGVALATLLG